MTETQDQDGAPALTDEDTLRQRLLGRIAVAAVVIVGLLGSLAVFDALYAPAPSKVPAKIATVKPLPSEPAAEPATTAQAPADPVPAADAAPAPGADTNVTEDQAATGKALTGNAKPESTAATSPVTPKETTMASAAPALTPLPAERLTKPASAQPTMAHPGSSVLPVAKPLAPLPEGTGGAMARGPELGREVAKAAAGASIARSAPASRPITQATGSAPTGDMSRGFALQLGVFTNFANAEDLRGKLEAAGIPATVEARVRAGPFASRAEVDAARTKLRALGISESILIAVRH